MRWFDDPSRRQQAGLAALGVVGGIGLAGAVGSDPPPPEPRIVVETVTETVTEVVTEPNIAALEVESERVRLERLEASIDRWRNNLKKRTRKLDRREDRLEAAAAEAEEPQQQAVVSAPDPEPEPAAPAYFANCDAARAAGAAPVYRGDPCYGGHLDRDGDGVGCE